MKYILAFVVILTFLFPSITWAQGAYGRVVLERNIQQQQTMRPAQIVLDSLEVTSPPVEEGAHHSTRYFRIFGEGSYQLRVPREGYYEIRVFYHFAGTENVDATPPRRVYFYAEPELLNLTLRRNREFPEQIIYHIVTP